MTTPAAALAGAYRETTGALAVTLVTTPSLSLTPTTDVVALTITSPATSASGIDLNSVNTSGVVIDVDVIPANNSNANDTVLDLTYSLTVTDGATYTKQGRILRLTNSQTQTSGTITDSADCLVIVQAGDSGKAISITHGGTGNAIDIASTSSGYGINIDQNAALASGKSALRVASNTAAHAGWLVSLSQSHVASGTGVLSIENASVSQSLYINTYGVTATSIDIDAPNTSGIVIDLDMVPGSTSTAQMLTLSNTGANASTGTGVVIDHDGATGLAMDIDRDGNSGARIWALKIDCDNAGLGGVGAIDVSALAAGDAVFHLPVDTGGVGAAYGRMAVYVVGVGIKYVALYEAA